MLFRSSPPCVEKASTPAFVPHPFIAEHREVGCPQHLIIGALCEKQEVYKRQMISSAINSTSETICVDRITTVSYTHLLLPTYHKYIPSICNHPLHSPYSKLHMKNQLPKTELVYYPVSYTHLDVYKRQNENSLQYPKIQRPIPTATIPTRSPVSISIFPPIMTSSTIRCVICG